LPMSYVITIRGCKQGVFSGIPDAYRHFLAGGESTRTAEPAVEQETDSALREDFDLANASLSPFLQQLFQNRLAWPVVGFELEANGRVAATAEMAWPDLHLALLASELTTDQEVFKSAGWQTFAFDNAGLTALDVSAIITLLPPRK